MSDPSKAVFLSYASQDAEAAKRICEALRAAGVEVWFDAEGGLEHGDEWDAKIRRQIKECVLFLPIISANTQAREEGYFRLEWDLAAERARTIASGVPFILPVIVDDTKEPDALVPDRFRAVQWTRLSGGVVPAEVLQRFLKLWSHRTGVLKQQAAGGRQQPDDGTRKPEPGNKNVAQRPRWLAPVIAGGVIALLALMLTRPWEKAGSPPVEPSARRSAPAAAKSSEARQLVAKAWEQMNKASLARAELEIADGFAQRATEIESDNADAWAAWSQVDSWYVYHNFDDSPFRREGARTKAARALQLAPGSYEARLAQACYLVRSSGGRGAATSIFDDEAKTLLTALLNEAAAEPRALLALGILQRNSGDAAAARATFEKLADNPAFVALAWNEIAWAAYLRGDYREAEVAVDRSVALQPCWPNLVLKLSLAQWWTGDLDQAKAMLDKIPVAVRQEDHGVAMACQLYYERREPENLLRVLAGVSRDWLRSNASDGPKAFWAGLAHELAGHKESAQLQWQAALQQTEQRLAAHPDSGNLLTWKGQLLAKLGRRDEAERALRLARDSGAGWVGFGNAQAPIINEILLGHEEAALGLLEATNFPVATYRNYPDFDSLRSNPRFQAVVARLEADPRYSPKAKLATSQNAEDREQRTAPAPSLSRSTPPDAKSIAVLAFANLSDAKSNEYFSDGISEELLNVLAKIPGLKVAARTSAFYFKGKEVPIPEIAQKLGVAYVVEGSVRRAGDKVRITAQLIKAAGGFHVWSDTFTRDLKDIFAVQDEIAGLIAQNLELKMGVGTLEARREVNPEAHRLLLEGWHHLALRTAAGFDQAETAFNAALKLDPQFAPAHSGLANVSALRGRYRVLAGLGRSNEFAALALAQGRLALQLDPSLAEAHAAMGSALTDNRQFDEADAEFRQALAVNPSYGPSYHWYCHVFAGRGRLDLALQQTDRSVALDPYAFIAHFIRIAYATDARRFASALAEADQAATLRAEVFLPNEAERIRCLVGLGRRAEAVAVARRALQHPDLLVTGWWCAGDALYALRQCGAEAEALATGEALLKRIAPDNYMRGYILCALGRYAEGLPALATAPAIVQGRLSWIPMFDAVRDTPAYQQLMVRLNCVEEDKVARATLARMLKEQEAKK